MNATATRIFAGAGAAQSQQGTKRGGLFRRSDHGGDWEQLGNGLPANAEVHAIVVRPDNPSEIFAGTQDGPYRSTDGGDHWQRLGFPESGAMIWSLTIHPTRPNVLYAGTAPIALYRSLDGGANWHRLSNAVSPAHCERAGFDSRVLRITVDPRRPEDIYAALVRQDDGPAWDQTRI